MKLLVFGQSGQLGRAIAALQQVRSGAVAVLSVSRHCADLSDPARCAAVIAATDADVVVNAAAWTDVTAAEARPAAAMAINATAPTAMAIAAVRRGLPFIHISSDYVFDGSGARAWRPDDPTAPATAYGISKRAGERGVAAAFAGTRVPFATIRTSWLISGHGQNFALRILAAGRQRGQVSVVADQIGGPTSADDLAILVLRAAQRLRARSVRSGIYHFAGAPNVSWATLTREVFRAAKLDSHVIDVASQARGDAVRRPLNSRLDCTETLRLFGIPPSDWRAALPAIVAASPSAAQVVEPRSHATASR